MDNIQNLTDLFDAVTGEPIWTDEEKRLFHLMHQAWKYHPTYMEGYNAYTPTMYCNAACPYQINQQLQDAKRTIAMHRGLLDDTQRMTLKLLNDVCNASSYELYAKGWYAHKRLLSLAKDNTHTSCKTLTECCTAHNVRAILSLQNTHTHAHHDQQEHNAN